MQLCPKSNSSSRDAAFESEEGTRRALTVRSHILDMQPTNALLQTVISIGSGLQTANFMSKPCR